MDHNINLFPSSVVVFVIFLALKLTDTVSWSWWWIFAPLAAPWVIVLSFMVLLVLLALTFGWRIKRTGFLSLKVTR